MPYIAPFKGLRYDVRRVGSLAKVVTPPYDVISPKGQAEYYRRHPCNFVRVVFGKEYPSDKKTRNRYSRAKETFHQWIRSGILRFDEEPSLYPHLQEDTLDGRPHKRWGVIALVRLDSPGIYPHEETRGAPKLDRIRLLEAAEASLSPIFGLIPDLEGIYRKFVVQSCRSKKPVADVRLDGVRHRLWKISDPRWIRRLTGSLRRKELVIADGHHRFEAALFYRNARRAHDPAFTPNAPYNFAMFYLAAAGSEEPGLLPTHRILHKAPSLRLEKFMEEASVRSIVRSIGNLSSLVSRLRSLGTKRRLGISFYTGNGGVYLLEPRREISYQLDVEWLHQEILPQWIGANVEVSYTQDAGEATRLLRRGGAKALFLMQPPRLQDVLDRARAATRMPGKTTYFYPKPLAGLVEYKFGAVPGLRGTPSGKS